MSIASAEGVRACGPLWTWSGGWIWIWREREAHEEGNGLSSPPLSPSPSSLEPPESIYHFIYDGTDNMIARIIKCEEACDADEGCYLYLHTIASPVLIVSLWRQAFMN